MLVAFHFGNMQTGARHLYCGLSDSVGERLLCSLMEDLFGQCGGLRLRLVQVLEEYAAFVNNNGLTMRGLSQCYKDGVSDIGRDYLAVGLGSSGEDQVVLLQDSTTRAANEPIVQSPLVAPFRDCTNTVSSPGRCVTALKPISSGRSPNPRRESVHFAPSPHLEFDINTEVCGCCFV